MNETVAAKLRQINLEFYNGLADPFTATRHRPHDGFFTLLYHLPPPPLRQLDVGCGNGRFGAFLNQQGVISEYVGVDYSDGLLANVPDFTVPVSFFQRDMTAPGFLDDLPSFDLISCMAAMHHIPGRTNRVRFLRALKGKLAENGRIIISNWQPIDSERQRRKIRDWSEVGLSAADVEPNDYLLTWKHGGFAYRYVTIINETEMQALAAEAELSLIHQFRSDGREGNLSLYNILSH